MKLNTLMYATTAALAIGIFASGCATRNEIAQIATAGPTGCSPKEVVMVEEPNADFSTARTWVASCQGKTYRCSGASDSKGAYVNVACTPIKR